ncbi:unnamed protein product [Bathycoccus prasinos]
MSRRKNPHPQRAVNARTVLKVVKGRREEEEGEEKEGEPLVLRSRMFPDAEVEDVEEANRQIRKVKNREKGEKFKIRERSLPRGERENIARMIPLNTNLKPDEHIPPKPALDATTISPPALVQQKVSLKGGGLNQTNNQLPPIAPLPEHLQNADTETKLLYFREAKRVSIEKCRENRCGNDEVTGETHGLGEFTCGTNWKRPGLRECKAQEFAYDFFKFHEQRGEFDYENVWDKLDRLISRSGKPFDLLTFYGEVCRRGGFGRNRVEAKCRFSISKIFKVMFNYFDQHSYTDIGNKLFDVYELFFLPYERAHSQEDVAEKWENREGVPRVQDIANQFYYFRERKEVEKAQIAMHLRRGKKYDPNFVPMFRMSVHRSLLEGENNINNDNDAKGVEQEKYATN